MPRESAMYKGVEVYSMDELIPIYEKALGAGYDGTFKDFLSDFNNVGEDFLELKSGGEVLSRPMFRPQIVRRQAGTSNKGEVAFDPRKFNILDKLGVISNKTLNMQAPDKEYQLNIDDAMTNPQLLDTVFEMITSSTGFDLDAFLNMGESQREDYLKTIKGKLIFGKAKGGEMKSDAVGIADGLDQETPKADPNTEGVAKVSPAQYVELMNQVRGDEVPLEGRVQELAMTVGEKDAQDTPLSVLALVQPVFELQEKQGGLAAAPGAQQMMQQQNPMMMKEGGIVYRQNGTDQEGENAFTTLGSIYDPAQIEAIQQFGKEFFGLGGGEFDTQAARAQYEQMLMNKDQMREQAYLDAAPLLLQLGATALNPEANLTDVFTVGATNLAKFGRNVGAQTKQIQDTALKMALADKQKEENKENAFISAVAPEIIKNAFTNPQDAALKALDITSKTLENLEKEAKLGILDESLQVQLATDIATLERMKTENRYLGTGLQLSIETQLEQLYGIQYDNTKKQLDNEYQTIINSFVEGEKNAALEGQLLENINKQLNNVNLGIQNEYLRTEKDLGIEQLNANINLVLGQSAGQAITNEKGLIELENFDAMQTLELIQKQEEINKLIADQKELNFEQINSEASFRKEFKQLQVYKNTDLRYTAFNNLLAAANEDSAAGDVAFIFEFMRMVDPNSVVKEGEFQLAEDASPLMLKLDKLLNKAKTGERLLPSQRDEFLSTAAGILDKSINIYNDTEAEYKRIAGNIFKDSDVNNIVVGIQFDPQILGSLENEKSFDDYLKSIGIN